MFAEKQLLHFKVLQLKTVNLLWKKPSILNKDSIEKIIVGKNLREVNFLIMVLLSGIMNKRIIQNIQNLGRSDHLVSQSDKNVESLH